MTSVSVHNAIRTRWGTEVEDAQSLTTQYDNAPMDPPTSTETRARVWIRGTVSRQASLATTTTQLFRHVGDLVGQLFVPLEDGMDQALALADAAVAAFRATTAGGVTYRTPVVETIGRDGGHWQVNVTIPWYANEYA